MTEKFNPLDYMWIKKHQPKTVKDIAGDELREKLLLHMKNPMSMQHMMFHSTSPGTGKSTTAQAIINDLGADFKIINGSDDRGIETIRETVKEFSATKSSVDGMRRIIMLDEFEGTTGPAQEALTSTMDKYSNNVLFLFTTNNINKIYAPIKDRCRLIHFANPNKEDMYKLLENICMKEKLEYTKEGILANIDLNYPSIRSCVQCLQEIHTENKIVNPENVKRINIEFEDLWNDMITNKNYKSIRNFIFEHGVNSRELNLFFWDKACKINDLRIIQITAKNEAVMADGANPNVIFITSLIEMCK